jgi:tRNA nucleotidyltransferase (CCA-adding enzyme)
VLGELCLALEEPRPDAVLRLADSWGVTPQLLPWMAWNPQLAARCERLARAIDAGAAPPEPRLVWAGLLLSDLDAEACSALAARYPLPGDAATLLAEVVRLRELAPRLARAARASEVDQLLRPFSAAAIAVLHYAEPAVAQPALRYLQTLRQVRLPLDGHDLRRLGVAPGPRMGQLLEALRAAVLDGVVASKADAERWVREQSTDTGER